MTEVYVGTVVIDKRQNIFLIKENDINRIGKNRWNLPGGSVDQGESLIQAASRETQEETGYRVKVVSLLGCYKSVKGNKSWLYIVFNALPRGLQRPIADRDVREGRWFSRSGFLSLKSRDIVHSDMKIVYKLALLGQGLSLNTVKFISYD